jgi:malonate transporter MadL subunit
MLLLIVASRMLQSRVCLPPPTQAGVLFWSSIYVPIEVAMTASQNVRGATSGAVAIVAGVVVVAASFAIVPLISGLGRAEPIATKLEP